MVASRGHVRDLPKSKLGVDVENNFTPSTSPSAAREDLIRSSRPRPRKMTRSTRQPTRTGKGRPSPGIWPTCQSSIWRSPTV